MMLRYSLNETAAAERVECAVSSVLDMGLRTSDIMSEGMRGVGTAEMGDAVVEAIRG
jgi:3-isopropylmalate dehydrogenase